MDLTSGLECIFTVFLINKNITKITIHNLTESVSCRSYLVTVELLLGHPSEHILGAPSEGNGKAFQGLSRGYKGRYNKNRQRR